MFKKTAVLSLCLLALSGCDSASYVQRESPVKPYKDYRENSAAVIGVGEPVSARQLKANAVLRLEGRLPLGDVMERMANTYNVAIRYGAGVRRDLTRDVIIADLKFNEARNYIEDTYQIQIVREGERRILILPAADVARIKSFTPGNNIPLVEAVRALSLQCGINLVISENREQLARTRVSVAFRDITCTDAFEAILAPHGMSLVDKGDYFSIGGLPSRTWALNLFEPLRSEQQSTSYDAALGGGTNGSSLTNNTGSQTSGLGGLNNPTSISGGSSNGASTSGGGASNLVVRQERDLVAELLAGLDALLQESCNAANRSNNARRGFLTPPKTGENSTTKTRSSSFKSSCGYVQVNRAVGLIHMQAPREVLEAADALIKRTEDIASRRLLIEARIIAVNKDRSFQQGANLAGRINLGRNSDFGFGFEGGLNGSEGLGIPDGPVSGILSDLANRGGGFGFRDNSLQSLVNFLESFTTTYQLMQPTMEVMDRQKAVMIDGRNDVFFIRESQVITGEGGNVNNVTATERRQFEGIQFSVTAQISDGEEPHTIALQIPITEIIGTEPLQQVFNNETIVDEIPVVNTRIIDQKIRVRDGEVKVVGGLTRTMAVDRESGIPLLRGIPIAGKLANEERIEFEEVEFLVLLQARRVR